MAAQKEKCRSEQTPLWLIQAMTLSCIGLLHSSGNEQSKVFTLNAFGDLVNFTIREGLLCAANKSTAQYGDIPLEQKWHDWVEDEIRRRTGYLIWVCSFERLNMDYAPSYLDLTFKR
jgi:hypothetical protein